MDTDVLRRQPAELLAGAGPHKPFEGPAAGLPDDALNPRAPNVNYPPWHLLEHSRLTQADILDYVINPAYVELDWPLDYWPDPAATATRIQLDATSRGFPRAQAAAR